MPTFKSTYNILKKPDEDEVYNPNWFDTPFLQLPPSHPWDYKREMKIEDVDIWEVLVEHGGGLGIYASWCPYAEFYLIATGSDFRNQWIDTLDGILYNYNDIFFETYYGPMAQKKVRQRAKELGLVLPNFKVWVDPEDMWLYTEKETESRIIIP